MSVSRCITRRIVRNAAIAVGLNLGASIIVELIGAHRFSVQEVLWHLLLPVCLFNVFLLAMTGGIMAAREEKLMQRWLTAWKNRRQEKEPIEHIIYHQDLPGCVADYINLIVKKMRYRGKARREVARELTGHFADALAEGASEAEKQRLAKKTIDEFGDPALLGQLIRRGKNRCRPAWIRGFQAIGVFIILFGLYTLWFVCGSPTIKIDYLAVMNKMHSQGVTDQNNAMDHYEKAESLFVEPPASVKDLIDGLDFQNSPIGKIDLTDSQWALVGKWIEQNEPAWQEFVAGSKKPHCFTELQYDSSNKEKRMAGVTYEDRNDIVKILGRHFRRLGLWRIWMDRRRGEMNQALQDCMVMIQVTRNLHNNGNLLEHMIAVLIGKNAHEEILHIIANSRLSADDLEKYQQQLAWMYPQGYLQLDIEGQRAGFLDMVQHVFTEGGIGGGHLIPGQLKFYLESTSEAESEKPPYYLISMLHSRRDETVAKGNEIWDQVDKYIKMSPYQRHIHINDSVLVNTVELPKYKYFLLRHPTPVMRGRTDSMCEAKAIHEATITVLALQRWRLAKGAYPESLQELADGGYLQQLPDDPYSDGILKYQKRGDDFVLYSLGADFEDDQGVQDTDDRRSHPWHGSGDCVFWPVPVR